MPTSNAEELRLFLKCTVIGRGVFGPCACWKPNGKVRLWILCKILQKCLVVQHRLRLMPPLSNHLRRVEDLAQRKMCCFSLFISLI